MMGDEGTSYDEEDDDLDFSGSGSGEFDEGSLGGNKRKGMFCEDDDLDFSGGGSGDCECCLDALSVTRTRGSACMVCVRSSRRSRIRNRTLLYPHTTSAHSPALKVPYTPCF